MILSPARHRTRAALGLLAAIAFVTPPFGQRAQAANPAPTPPAGHGRVGFLTPHPPYPLQARAQHLEGVVTVKITWAAAGNVKEVVVVKSSGSRILDENTVNFIKAKWRSLIGKEVTHTITQEYFLR